jgi:hypothetical protein
MVEDFQRFDDWRRGLRPGSLLHFLRVGPNWLKDSAAALLHRADNIDPLGKWVDVVREADPGSWDDLKGEARCAVDFRIAAEILLGYYEDLVKAGRADPLPKPERRWRGEFDRRLKPKGPLDQVLTDFGLSPHPSLIVVVEGDTEEMLFPRLMKHFAIRTDEDFISIQNAEGVRTGLGPLISYAIAPRTEPEENGRYLRLLRPPTRLLVVTDAEPPMTTAETWDGKGQSFEFAHFTDREIARAIDRLDQSPRKPPVADRTRYVAKVRARGGNLKSVLSGISKVALADALWLVLERKVERAEQYGTEARIPLVRVIDRATELAHHRRRNIVIPVRDP